jgi:hypothetical protein
MLFAAPTPENEARKSLIASAKSKTDSISLQGKRLVSDKEWRLMQEQVNFLFLFICKCVFI